MKPLAILGTGSWGTALAIHLASNEQIVHLWGRDSQKIEMMRQTRTNEHYLPGIILPKPLGFFDDLSQAIENVSDIMLATPSSAFRSILQTLKPLISEETRIIWTNKGIDSQSNQLFSDVLEEVLGPRAMAVLSGPSFSREVAKGLPTAVSIASNDQEFAHDLVQRFNRKAFRVYISDDLIGVQLGGALKNVIAIAVGMSDGLQYGVNAKSALITRGLAEITRLGTAMGAKPITFTGLSGLGDLILTCTDDQSRNRRLGFLLGQGLTLQEAQKTINRVIEGIHTTAQVMYLKDKYQINMPICELVHNILIGKSSPYTAVIDLLARTPTKENIS